MMNMDLVTRRERILTEAGYECRFFWECEVDEMLKVCDFLNLA